MDLLNLLAGIVSLLIAVTAFFGFLICVRLLILNRIEYRKSLKEPWWKEWGNRR